jgi:outer membrane protein
MSEYQGIQQELRSLGQQWRNELRDMQREIDLLKEDFAAKEILYTEDLRNQRVQEIETKVRQREQYLNQRFGPEGDYFKRQQELLEPIQRRVFEAIAVVAEREGYDFVFDRSQQPTLLYAQPEWDLSNAVLLQLGINPDDTSN